ncbi:MAG: DUF1289 domain-containing protein [Pseudomonadota bacterium]
MTLASPCTGVCKLDDATGWCLGCARSGPEIADWRAGTTDWRSAIWSAIPVRLSQMGVACRRLPWSTAEIRDFAAKSLRDGAGTWTMGVMGGVAEFAPTPGHSVQTAVMGDTIEARTSGGAIRMLIDDGVRALTFDPPSTPMEQARVVLAVKRERGRLPVANGIADLGPDAPAIVTEDSGQLFDLGLGRKEARFCVRTSDPDMIDALTAAAGLPLDGWLRTLGPVLGAKSPTRVVETALGRIEVTSRIPPPGGTSPEGPHTHLLPDHLQTDRALPAGIDLPRAYLPGAMFYPAQAA